MAVWQRRGPKPFSPVTGATLNYIDKQTRVVGGLATGTIKVTVSDIQKAVALLHWDLTHLALIPRSNARLALNANF